MLKFPGKEECIFKNYKLMFLHTFRGLSYLESKGIVHGDVKGTYVQICMCMTDYHLTYINRIKHLGAANLYLRKSLVLYLWFW